MNEQLLRERGLAGMDMGFSDFHLFLRLGDRFSGFFDRFLRFGAKFLRLGDRFLEFGAKILGFGANRLKSGAKILEFGTSFTFFKGNFAASLHTYSHSPLLLFHRGGLGAVFNQNVRSKGGDFCDVIS